MATPGKFTAHGGDPRPAARPQGSRRAVGPRTTLSRAGWGAGRHRPQGARPHVTHPLTASHHQTHTRYEKRFYFKSKYQADTCKTTYKVELRCLPSPGCLRAPQIRFYLPRRPSRDSLHAPSGWKGEVAGGDSEMARPHSGLRFPGGQWAPPHTPGSGPARCRCPPEQLSVASIRVALKPTLLPVPRGLRAGRLPRGGRSDRRGSKHKTPGSTRNAF